MAMIISKTTPIKFWYLPLVLPSREVRPVIAVGHYSHLKRVGAQFSLLQTNRLFDTQHRIIGNMVTTQAKELENT